MFRLKFGQIAFHYNRSPKTSGGISSRPKHSEGIKTLLKLKMKVGERSNMLLLLLCSLFFSVFSVEALSYDYNVSIECLANPHKPQYGGGMVVNPELDEGLEGWNTFGDAKVETRISRGGNSFIVAQYRNHAHDSFSQKFYLDKSKLYTFSAWLQISHGNAEVRATFKTPTGFKHAGSVIAESGCWSMLKGGLIVNASGPAELYFESNNVSVEIWADSISLQPFTEDQWRSHQDQSIQKARKGKVKLQAVDAKGNPLANATVFFTQKSLGFPLGCAINDEILRNTAYQNWFTSRFKVTTFENEMKWYSTEKSWGKEDYSVPDAMLNFAQKHGISVRGHNVFWDDPNFQPWWVKSLSPKDLGTAAQRRLFSIVRRYSGKLIAWDVVNENLHFSFLESKLGKSASSGFYKEAHALDSRTTLFLNDYNTIEDMRDHLSTPDQYLKKVQEIQNSGYNGPLGIGLEGHFSIPPNLPYIRASIDKLAAAKLPIWITELDVARSMDQAKYLEQILREVHSHGAINGIVIWSGWRPGGCYRMCLTDNNFKNLPTGDVVDKLLREWGGKEDWEAGTTDEEGYLETSLFHGDYEVTVAKPAAVMADSSELQATQSFKVESMDESRETTLHVKVSA
ncbi:endo-1,4-beta-xylanase 5-like [Cornus florida]|uniref:endo-1,4-beta-xylanase 5-like n=1 Tax=Cornus florida TaxID=4283 RepID=UPI00289F9560|nr:endo-1,4-beta-xylanase 5-like [Cornus florida]